MLLHRLPAETGQPGEQRLDPALAIKGRRTQVIEEETELLVFGADAPVGALTHAGREVLDQFTAIGDRGFGDAAGARHGGMIRGGGGRPRSEEQTSELQTVKRITNAVIG